MPASEQSYFSFQLYIGIDKITWLALQLWNFMDPKFGFRTDRTSCQRYGVLLFATLFDYM